MKRAALMLVACVGAVAQTDKLEFEVASVKLVKPDFGKPFMFTCNGGPGADDPQTFRCILNLKNMVAWAYSFNMFQVAAPDWMQQEIFNISAKVPPGITKEGFPMLIRNLLTERFKLEVHHEIRQIAKYELMVAKGGPKFKEAVETAEPKDDGKSVDSVRMKVDKEGYPVLASKLGGMAINVDRGRMYYPNETMERLVDFLSGQIGKPVTDATGLKGTYEIGLYWSGASLSAADAGDRGPTLMQAVQQQLGLRLEAKTGPVDFLVVDHAEKMPTAN
jgi:uncharacterized protein (TIGR03435 family)